ncbi:MAG TPA: methyltransferase domain-containing protein, partial [bacterium]|nr:methyltransferase domain-containing protein [bacterium]
DFVVWLLGNHDPAQTRILDLACGTGRHLLALARRGYRVEGLDMSPDMLGVARGKLEAAALTVPLHTCDLRAIPGEFRDFDLATCFLTALGHLLTNADLDAGLARVFQVLKPGGWFLLDTLNYPALLERFKPTLEERVATPGGFIQRTTVHHVDSARAILGHEEFVIVSEGPQVRGHHFKTELRMHSWPELEGHLQRAGFVETALYGSPTAREPAQGSAARLWAVAQRPAG